MDTVPDSFDDLLRSTMHRRPEPPAPADLALRAIQNAQARPATVNADRLRRYRLISRLASLAAVMLIGLIVYVGLHQLAARDDLTLTPGEAWTETSATTTDVSTTTTSVSSDSPNWSGIIIAGVIGLTGLGAAVIIRQSSPFVSPAGMLIQAG